MTKGLSDNDIPNHRQDFGYNELQRCVESLHPFDKFPENFSSPTENQFMKFVSYFRGPILYVMEIAVILAAGLRDWIDFGVIVSYDLPANILFHLIEAAASVDWYLVLECRSRLVPGEVSISLLPSASFSLIPLDRQAGDIVAQLKAGIAMKAIVVRNGKEQEIEARDLVPGDIVSSPLVNVLWTYCMYFLRRSFWKKAILFPRTQKYV